MTKPTPSPADIARSAPTRSQDEQKRRHRRGEIWMVIADPNAPAVGSELWSNRPALIVSNNVTNGRAGFAQVVYLTTATRKRTGPTHVELPQIEGVGASLALCEQVHTVDSSRLKHRMGVVAPAGMREIDAALALSLSVGRDPQTFPLFYKWEEHVKLHGIDMSREIDAIAGATADERVQALTRALSLVAAERDAYQTLYESIPARGDAMAEVERALSAAP